MAAAPLVTLPQADAFRGSAGLHGLRLTVRGPAPHPHILSSRTSREASPSRAGVADRPRARSASLGLGTRLLVRRRQGTGHPQGGTSQGASLRERPRHEPHLSHSVSTHLRAGDGGRQQSCQSDGVLRFTVFLQLSTLELRGDFSEVYSTSPHFGSHGFGKGPSSFSGVPSQRRGEGLSVSTRLGVSPSYCRHREGFCSQLRAKPQETANGAGI